MTGVFGAVNESLECACCGHCGLLHVPDLYGASHQGVLSMIVYPCLVSAASTVPQIPYPPASALLDTQGMGPIAQVCPAKTR